MTPDKYHQLQKVFAGMNTAIVEFYDELLKLMPDEYRSELLEGFRSSFNNTSYIYKDLQDKLFKYEQQQNSANSGKTE